MLGVVKDSFYNVDWEKKAYERAEQLAEKDKQMLLSIFKNKTQNGNSARDLEKTARDIINFKRKFLPKKPLSEATFEELKESFGALFASTSSYHTIKDYRKHLLQFFKELRGKKYNPLDYDFMRGNDKIMKAKKSRVANSKQVLTQEEIETLINECGSLRDKAYIMASFDTMSRVGALVRVKIKDVIFKGKDIWLNLEKTKEEEAFKVGLTFSQPYVRKWLAVHPNHKPEQYLFCAKRRENGKTGYGIWRYSAISYTLKELIRKTGIKKPIHTHIFRGSGSTFWKSIGATDQTIENRGGWARGSKALRETYFVFEKEESHDSAKALLTGQKAPQEVPRFTPTLCVMCNWQNEAGAEYCFNCHHQLALKEVAKEANLITILQAELEKTRKQQEIAQNKFAELEKIVKASTKQDLDKVMKKRKRN